MFVYPVHLQMFPSSPCLISSSDGDGFFRSSSFVAMIMPGVQKPHCRPCLFPEPLLYRVQSVVPGKALYRGYARAVRLHRQTRTGLHRGPVHIHRARAALAGVAPDLRAGEVQRLPEIVHQEQPWLHFVPVLASVDRDFYGHFQGYRTSHKK